jgi:hypothetical protein
MTMMKAAAKAVLRSLIAVLCLSGLALAGSSTISVLDSGGAQHAYRVGTDGSGNFFGMNALCDGAACANMATVTPGGSLVTSSLRNYNGSGSTQHSAVTTAYAAGELFANNTTGNVAPALITVTGTNGGTGLIDKAIIESSGPNQPPTISLFLYSALPTISGLADRSAYVGPYAADITSGIYIGSLVCSNWTKTSDASAQWFSECLGFNGLAPASIPFKAVAGQTAILALEEIGAPYTPLSGETHTYLLSTIRDN